MKKILNIFVSLSLITTGTSNVVACGSHKQTDPPTPSPSPPKPDDQQIVNEITRSLENQKFIVDENPNGINTFNNYKKIVLKNIQDKLSDQEKSLVSLPSRDNTIKLNTNSTPPKAIDVHIKSHKIVNDINIYVQLKYNAQSIANAINGKTITVLQTGGYKQSESTNKYKTSIESQINNLLTSAEQQSGYQISGWENTTIYWPYWEGNKKTGREIDKNILIPLTINIGQDIAKVKAKITLEFKYNHQKKVIDDPNFASKDTALQVPTRGQKVSGDQKTWTADQIDEALDTAWNFGADFKNYVTFVPTTLIPNQPVVVKMYCPLLGYTIDNPRYFYAEAY